VLRFGVPFVEIRVVSLIAQLERQPPARQESTGAASPAVEEVVAAGAQEGATPAAVAAEEAAAAKAQEEVPAEGGLVDIASILGAPAVMIVRSSLLSTELSRVVLGVVVELE
jgi:hypothetical protein